MTTEARSSLGARRTEDVANAAEHERLSVQDTRTLLGKLVELDPPFVDRSPNSLLPQLYPSRS
jgi:hypothetical protein